MKNEILQFIAERQCRIMPGSAQTAEGRKRQRPIPNRGIRALTEIPYQPPVNGYVPFENAAPYSGMAVASMVLGIISMFINPLTILEFWR